jgi:SOS-response transcriptional repressor LexA
MSDRNSGETTRVLGFRQIQVIGLIRADLEERGYIRSYQAIADTLGMGGKHYVANVINRLERRGLLRRAGPIGRRAITLPQVGASL